MVRTDHRAAPRLGARVTSVKRSNLTLVAGICCGAMLGLGGYTFMEAEGLAYLSNDPEACANCHVMRDHLASWQKSAHHTVATCNDCHTPHAPIPKLVAKAINGWNHSVRFTLQDYPEHIRITARNSRNLEHNCIECHRPLVDGVFPASADAHSGRNASDLHCVHCHAGVGHGP